MDDNISKSSLNNLFLHFQQRAYIQDNISGWIYLEGYGYKKNFFFKFL